METALQHETEQYFTPSLANSERLFANRQLENIKHSTEYWNLEIDEQRLLTEMDHLRLAKDKEGIHRAEALADIKQNYVTAIYERAIPNGVSGFTYNNWLGKTPESVAASGYRWHRSAQAHKRVDVELGAAGSLRELPVGFAKVIVSPRMSESDAPKAVAKSENLDQFDSIQVYYSTESGIQAEAILVEGVQLPSWYAMLSDQENLFGKSIEVDAHNDSALDIMSAHSEMIIPANSLKSGVVTILEEVLSYEKDIAAYAKIKEQLDAFAVDQTELSKHASTMADEWLRFDIQLEEALNETGRATGEVADFIQDQLPKLDIVSRRFVEAHQTPDGFVMSEKLAALTEDMKRNTVWARTGVRVDNQEIIKQIQPETLQHLKQRETAYDILVQRQMHEELIAMSRQTDSAVASMNINTGSRGCPAGGASRFSGGLEQSQGINNRGQTKSEHCPTIENGQFVKCPGCKKMVNVIVEGSKKDKLYCPSSGCKLAKKGKKTAKKDTKTNNFNLFSFASKKKDKQPDKIAA